jgi:hypothetical protein
LSKNLSSCKRKTERKYTSGRSSGGYSDSGPGVSISAVAIIKSAVPASWCWGAVQTMLSAGLFSPCISPIYRTAAVSIRFRLHRSQSYLNSPRFSPPSSLHLKC